MIPNDGTNSSSSSNNDNNNGTYQYQLLNDPNNRSTMDNKYPNHTSTCVQPLASTTVAESTTRNACNTNCATVASSDNQPMNATTMVVDAAILEKCPTSEPSIPPTLPAAADVDDDSQELFQHGKIHKMDSRSVQKIVSGQAITDLASAVKELVDNALDAGSQSINSKSTPTPYRS